MRATKEYALLLAALVAIPAAKSADEALPPPAGRARPAVRNVTPTAEQLRDIKAKLAELTEAIRALKAANADDDLIVDAESCGWVVGNIVRVPGGFISEDVLNRCIPLLNDGLRRAAQIKAGTAAWPNLKGRVNRAYHSVVDGTAQGYHLIIPGSYDPAKPIPLYVYLHGRSPHDPDLGHTWVGGSDRAGVGGRDAGYIRVEAFGRGNNSFRYAGETDVFEVIASVRRRYNIDPERILLAGFSMGGAGSWQIGLHNADQFCGLEIDAGVIGNRVTLDDLAPAQAAANATYGITVGHALNIFNIPLVAYAGENDAQLAASTAIREQLGREGYAITRTGPYRFTGQDIDTLFLANPGQGHSHATGDTARRIDEFTAANFARGRVVPDHIRFVTYTTRYNRSHWVTVDGLETQFRRATVDAQRDPAKTNFTIRTENISRLVIADAAAAKRITIDGEVVAVKPANQFLLMRDAGHWRMASGKTEGLRKQHNLQGPIADAFFDSFLCVTPTGQPYHAAVAVAAQQEQERFAAQFAREYCGETRAKNDTAITEADIAASNLVLFGDPSSNQVLARIAAQLPIKWTREQIVVGDKTYAASDHVPVFIYPNPLNPKRYVVVNSGLPAQGRGAPGYGDFAILKIAGANEGASRLTVEAGGVFDEHWQLPAEKI